SRIPVDRNRLDDVRIYRPLGQKLHFPDLRHLALEHLDEDTADDLPLLLRVNNSLQLTQKAIPRARDHQVQIEIFPVEFLDRFRLAFPHQAVVDVDTRQLSPNRTVNQGRRYRTVDPATQAENDPLVPNRLADLLHRPFN